MGEIKEILSEGIRADPEAVENLAEPAGMPLTRGPVGRQSPGEEAAPTALSSEAAVSSQQEAPHKPPSPEGTHSPLHTARLAQPLPEAWSSGQAVSMPVARCRVRASPGTAPGSGSRRCEQLQGQTNGREPSA